MLFEAHVGAQGICIRSNACNINKTYKDYLVLHVQCSTKCLNLFLALQKVSIVSHVFCIYLMFVTGKRSSRRSSLQNTSSTSGDTAFNALFRHSGALVDFCDLCDRYFKNRGMDMSEHQNMFLRIVRTTRVLFCHASLGKLEDQVMNRMAVNLHAIYMMVGLDMNIKTWFKDSFSHFTELVGTYVLSVKKSREMMTPDWNKHLGDVKYEDMKKDFEELDIDIMYLFWTCVSCEAAKDTETWKPAVDKWLKEKEKNDPKWKEKSTDLILLVYHGKS